MKCSFKCKPQKKGIVSLNQALELKANKQLQQTTQIHRNWITTLGFVKQKYRTEFTKEKSLFDTGFTSPKRNVLDEYLNSIA